MERVRVSYAPFFQKSVLMPQTIPVTLIPGDGIGPEIMDAVLKVLAALGAPFDWERQIAGLEGVKTAGDPLPPKTLDSIRRTRLAQHRRRSARA